ncbi:MAG TPA: MBL fold metallo-hydrolase [Candidatus Limnocylindria bacterium]|nr:MBL fold metallo-hydrolase [Candidatus Limnocylindria bacterium]
MGLTVRTFCLGPFATNAYLLICERSRETAIVDVGFDPAEVLETVRTEDLLVRLLLNTHAHYDHAAAMREVQQAVGGTYWLHPDDRFLLDGLAEQGAAFGLPPAQGPAEVHALADAQELPLGEERLTVLHTPGHSPGSVTFRWQDHLWSGDVLFAGSIGRTDLPGGSFEVLSRSIRERLFPLGDQVRVYPGHGPGTTLGAERQFNPFVGERAFLA